MDPQRDAAAKRVIPISLTVFFLLLATSFMGVGIGDDSLYMGDGRHMGLSSLITHHDWSPLYSLWFRFLGVFCHDPVARYFLSWGLIVCCIALVPTLFRRPAAWLYTLIVLSLPIVTDGPFVGLFASVMVLTGLCGLLRQRLSFAETLCASCILSFCVTFARPEYNSGVLICAAATLIAVVAEQFVPRAVAAAGPETPRSRTPAWLMLLAIVAISAVVLSLLKQAPSQRSGMAFAQHFNIRAAVHGLIPAGPDCWRSNYAELRFGVDTAHNAGDGTATLGQFLRANPRLFLGQILDNLTDPHAFLLLAYILVVALLPWLRKDIAYLRPASLFVLLLSLPPLAGTIVIFPHTHYAAIVIPAVTLFALQCIGTERRLRPSLGWVLVPGLALLAGLYVVRPRMEERFIPTERINFYRIECYRQWDQPAANTNPAVFPITEIPPVYVDDTRTLVYPSAFSTWSGFQSWAVKTQPAWISVDTEQSAVYGYPSLAKRYGVPQEQIAAFLQHDLGYTPHACSAPAQMTVYTHDRR